MTTTLQAWGNSQGVRLPKSLLAALHLEAGASLEVELSPKKDAIIVKPAIASARVRGRHRIEDLAAAMPKGYKAAEFDWGTSEQVKSLDFRSRGMKLIERAPQEVSEDVLAIIDASVF